MDSAQFPTQHSQFSPGQAQAPDEVMLSREPLPVRVLAHLLSYVFHPLFIPAYVMGFLLYVHPYAFIGLDERMKLMRLLSVIVSTLFLPAFAIFLLWRLQFIRSLFLRTQKERILPYVIAMVFYFWVWYVFNNLPDSPPPAKVFLLGVFLAVCGDWMANIWFKVSMHGTAMGGLVAFFIIQSLSAPSIGGLYLALAVLIAGLVCTARLIVGHHTRPEVYFGLLIGVVGQAVAALFT